MPVRPFTIAMRVMHQGRYGSGADDPRLLPLAWTLRDFVRGYGDTGGNALGVPYLSANRFVLGNAELRFPIPGAFSHGASFSPLPVEALVFTDASRFWIPPASSAARAGTLRRAGAGRAARCGRVRLRARRCASTRSAAARLDLRIQLPARF